MSLRINLNSAAMNAHKNLAATDSALGKSIQRLSSGYRINNSSDDPAGLVISENLRAQMGGLSQAIANSQDAVNLVKTAEGALTEVNSLLRSMRSLAVHAANAGANSTAAITADQTQITSAVASLDRIAANTSFGTRKLLDGSGAVSVTNLAPSTVASISAAASGTAFAPAGVAGNVTVNVTTASAAATKTMTAGTAYTAATDTVNNAGTITINGVGITIGATDTVQQAIDKINLETSKTGVTASFTVGNELKLDQQTHGSDKLIAYSESADVFNGAAASVTSGTDAVATVTINGAAATFASGKGKTLQNSAGDTITLLTGAVANLGTVGYAAGSGLSFQVGANAGETASVSISGTATDKLGTGVDGTYTSVKLIDVTKDAAAAIKVLDAAIAQVATQRASLGAFQKNVLESNMNSLTVTRENVTASESSIRDVDMAQEMTEFTRLNILSQAGTAMLTQANQAPQQLLSLLR